MKGRDRIFLLLLPVLLIGGLKLGQQLYRYYAFTEEREAIARLEWEMEEAGLGVIATQVRAEELRVAIERVDASLSEARVELEHSEREILRVPDRVAERRYREQLAAYNERVGERNALFRDWRAEVDSNHLYVQRYNSLVDSIRGLAATIGEPYYPVLSPAEIAVRREGAVQQP